MPPSCCTDPSSSRRSFDQNRAWRVTPRSRRLGCPISREQNQEKLGRVLSVTQSFERLDHPRRPSRPTSVPNEQVWSSPALSAETKVSFVMAQATISSLSPRLPSDAEGNAKLTRRVRRALMEKWMRTDNRRLFRQPETRHRDAPDRLLRDGTGDRARRPKPGVLRRNGLNHPGRGLALVPRRSSPKTLTCVGRMASRRFASPSSLSAALPDK